MNQRFLFQVVRFITFFKKKILYINLIISIV
jgi:hypothetical protein